MSKNVSSNFIIDARPTKDLFISMLVKDVPLIQAITDLIDNCIDGAKRRNEYDFSSLYVRITIDKDHFLVEDNCGGIPVNIARDYAFRFGRPPGMADTKHSVGQFGVGMKRAIFKLGSFVNIKSCTDNSKFNVAINVNEWKLDDQNWTFPFDPEEGLKDVDPDEIGTVISVTQLHPTVSEKFQTALFVSELHAELEAANQEGLNKGLSIVLNGIPLQYHPTEMLASDLLQPAYREFTLSSSVIDPLLVGPLETPVLVKIYAGIAKSDPEAAGWYILCNGRLVLKADQTITTGWGKGGETSIPKYHNQFARFRGYVFLDCDTARLLPWNTTKTGVDTDSPIYRAVFQIMITMMRPVIDFLNKLDSEKDIGDVERVLEIMVDTAKAIQIGEVKHSEVFEIRASTTKLGTRKANISFTVLKDQLDKVKDELGVSSNKEVGERVFNYYYEAECVDR